MLLWLHDSIKFTLFQNDRMKLCDDISSSACQSLHNCIVPSKMNQIMEENHG
jgi:hypothetical protein